MAFDVSEALRAQGLEPSDLVANRAGRVSARQLAQLRAARRRSVIGITALALVGLVGCLTIAHTMAQGVPGGEVPLAFGAVLWIGAVVWPLGYYYASTRIDPAKVASSPVTRLENAWVGAFLTYADSRGAYVIELNEQRYRRVPTELRRSHFGDRVHAYVVPAQNIVVAIEPADGAETTGAEVPVR